MSTIYPEYNQSNHAYSNIILSEFNNIATKNISAYATSNIRNNMTLGASSNVILEAYNQMNMICSSNAGYKVFNSSNEILKIQPSMIQSSNVKLVISGGDSKSTTCVSQTTLLTSNNNQQISTVNSNFLVSTSIKLTSNFEVAGNTYSTSLNMYKNITPEASNSNLSQVAYSFYINEYDQLQLVKYSKYGSNTSSIQTVNLFGTLASSNNLYYNSANYYKSLNLYNNINVVPIGSNNFMNQRIINGFTSTLGSASHNILYIPVNNKTYGWGYNYQNQIDGVVGRILSPKVITYPNISKFAYYVQGNLSSCGITEDGKLYVWAYNHVGQLGLGYASSTVYVYPPQLLTRIPYNPKVACVVTNNATIAVTTEGKAYGWGANNVGQLGINTGVTSILNPTLIPITDTVITASINRYSGNNYNSMLLTNNGYVYTFGDNVYGQIGNNTSNGYVATPYKVNFPNNAFIKAISSGAGISSALSSDGKVYMWGDNSNGKCGTGSTSNILTTPTLVSSLSNVFITSISCHLHTLAVSSNGQLYVWGDNTLGQLGTSNNTSYSTPQLLSNIPGNPSITNAYTGYYYSIIKTSIGSIYAFGANDQGQLGRGNTSTYINYPVLLSFA